MKDLISTKQDDEPLVFKERDLTAKEWIKTANSSSRAIDPSDLDVKKPLLKHPSPLTSLATKVELYPVQLPKVPKPSQTGRGLSFLVQKLVHSFMHNGLKEHKNLSRLHFQQKNKKKNHWLCSIQMNGRRIECWTVFQQAEFKIILLFQLSKIILVSKKFSEYIRSSNFSNSPFRERRKTVLFPD